jgi:hypothetical protein
MLPRGSNKWRIKLVNKGPVDPVKIPQPRTVIRVLGASTTIRERR